MEPPRYQPIYVVPHVAAQPAPVPPTGSPGRRPRSLVIAIVLVFGSLAVSAAGVVLLAMRMDHLLTGVDEPFRDLLQLGVVYAAVVWTVFWTAGCLPFAVMTLHGWDWARITLTVVLAVKTVANLGGGRIVLRFALAPTFYDVLGMLALLLTVATAVLDAVAVVLLWLRPTSGWFSAAAAHRAYRRTVTR
ncbi:MAG: hypothetical protein GEV07_02265 [Streptosporangiales bacterium]|nr:hypothetical protein [Streptosporangiales bacterium]